MRLKRKHFYLVALSGVVCLALGGLASGIEDEAEVLAEVARRFCCEDDLRPSTISCYRVCAEISCLVFSDSPFGVCLEDLVGDRDPPLNPTRRSICFDPEKRQMWSACLDARLQELQMGYKPECNDDEAVRAREEEKLLCMQGCFDDEPACSPVAEGT